MHVFRIAVLTALLAAFSTVACSSPERARSASEPSGIPLNTTDPDKAMRVRYIAYPSAKNPNGQNLALVNQAHSDRTELYSKTVKLEAAGTKVATNEVLEETVKYLDDQGLKAHAQQGAAPTASGGVWSAAIEVEHKGRLAHWAVSAKTPIEERKRFQDCYMAVVGIWSNVYGLQSVDRAPDWETTGKSKTPKGN